MAAVNINKEQFQQMIQGDKPVLVDFWAPWCGYCRRIGPAYEKVAEEYGDRLEVVKINIGRGGAAGRGGPGGGDPHPDPVPGREGGGHHREPRVQGSHRPVYSGGSVPSKEALPMGEPHIYDMIVVGGGARRIHGGSLRRPGRAGYPGAGEALRRRADGPNRGRSTTTPALRRDRRPHPGREDAAAGGALRRKDRVRPGGAHGPRPVPPRFWRPARGHSRQNRGAGLQGPIPERWVFQTRPPSPAGAWPTAPPVTALRYKGKTVVVVGGGNSAAADALILSRISQKVILVHRRDSLRATKVYHRPLMEAKNLGFRWNSVVTELLHGDKLTGVKLRDVNTGEETVLPCDGVFISVGRNPPPSWCRASWSWTGAAMWQRMRPPRPVSPGSMLWATCGRSLCARW